MRAPARHRLLDRRFSSVAWDDDRRWLAHALGPSSRGTDRSVLRRLNAVIKDARRSPFEGIGKPEPLKGDLSGYWSRRINDEHRLVYAARGDGVIVIACRYHYGS